MLEMMSHKASQPKNIVVSAQFLATFLSQHQQAWFLDHGRGNSKSAPKIWAEQPEQGNAICWDVEDRKLNRERSAGSFIWDLIVLRKWRALSAFLFTLAFSGFGFQCPILSFCLLKKGSRTTFLKLLCETLRYCGGSVVSIYMQKPQHDATNPKESFSSGFGELGKGNKISQHPQGSWPEQHRVDSLQASLVPLLETLTVAKLLQMEPPIIKS